MSPITGHALGPKAPPERRQIIDRRSGLQHEPRRPALLDPLPFTETLTSLMFLHAARLVDWGHCDDAIDCPGLPELLELPIAQLAQCHRIRPLVETNPATLCNLENLEQWLRPKLVVLV